MRLKNFLLLQTIKLWQGPSSRMCAFPWQVRKCPSEPPWLFVTSKLASETFSSLHCSCSRACGGANWISTCHHDAQSMKRFEIALMSHDHRCDAIDAPQIADVCRTPCVFRRFRARLIMPPLLPLLHANMGCILHVSDLQLDHPKLSAVAHQIGASFSQHGYVMLKLAEDDSAQF